MNMFQLLHGHAQNQMKGTILNALEIAFGYILLGCSQIQLLAIQIQNDNLHCLTEASFGFLAILIKLYDMINPCPET